MAGAKTARPNCPIPPPQLHSLWDCDYKRSFQILRILSRRKQEKRKSRKQGFKTALIWIISSGKMESGPGDLPGFKCSKAAANSLCEKVSEIFIGSGIVALQTSDTS